MSNRKPTLKERYWAMHHRRQGKKEYRRKFGKKRKRRNASLWNWNK